MTATLRLTPVLANHSDDVVAVFADGAVDADEFYAAARRCLLASGFEEGELPPRADVYQERWRTVDLRGEGPRFVVADGNSCGFDVTALDVRPWDKRLRGAEEGFDAADYRPLPVGEARDLAQRYEKSWIVILANDERRQVLHCTSYGASAEDKIVAARLGDYLTAQAGGQLMRSRCFEDFRYRPQAEAAAQIQQLQARIRDLEAAKN